MNSEYSGRSAVIPVLENSITITHAKRTVLDTLQLVLDELQPYAQKGIFFGSVPQNLLRQHEIEYGGNGVPAWELVQQALDATGKKLTWHILYDPTLKLYALNIE